MTVTRTSHRWQSVPGNFDRLHTAYLFDSDNAYGIPSLARETDVPRWLHPYGTRIRTDDLPEGGCLHFFLDDFRFETVWNRFNDTLEGPKRVGFALTPMFSIYTDWPLALQIWNTYRNRWMGAFWQSHGIKVIPTIVWTDERSFEFAYAGVPKGSVVATGGIGLKRADEETKQNFDLGYHEMVRRIEPSHVVFYGNGLPEHLYDLAPVTCYPTRWDSIKQTKAWLKHQEELGLLPREEEALHV